MKKALLLFAALLAACASSRAEVLIYQGTGSVRISPGTPLPPAIELYFLVDIASKQYLPLLFFKSNGQKTQGGADIPGDIDMTTSPIAGGGTARLIVNGSGGSTPPNFNYSILYIRGVQRSILVSTSGGAITRNEPRSLIGYQLNASESAGIGDFTELRLKVLYQEAASVKANNAGKTMQQTRDDLSAKLLAQGYQPL